MSKITTAFIFIFCIVIILYLIYMSFNSNIEQRSGGSSSEKPSSSYIDSRIMKCSDVVGGAEIDADRKMSPYFPRTVGAEQKEKLGISAREFDKYQMEKSGAIRGYMSPTSLRQFSAIMKIPKYSVVSKLDSILSSFIGGNNYKMADHMRKRRIIDGILNDAKNGKNDVSIYESMAPMIAKTNDFAEKHVKFAEAIADYIKTSGFATGSYLDVGCGNTGLKTKVVGEKLGSKEVWGTDIPKWMGKVVVKDMPINFKFVSDDGSLDFESGKFDIVSCFMVLHHIERGATQPHYDKTAADNKREKLIAECARCLKPGGILIIKEHDACSASDHMLIDIEHILYTISHYGATDIKKYINEYYAEYMNYLELDDAICFGTQGAGTQGAETQGARFTKLKTLLGVNFRQDYNDDRSIITFYKKC